MVLFLLRSDGAQLYDCGVFELGAIFENKVCKRDESWGWQEAGTDLGVLSLMVARSYLLKVTILHQN